ncbi:MAG: hypothetical protein WA082_04560 [Candidatus Moraniibacteriota bacterium]
MKDEQGKELVEVKRQMKGMQAMLDATQVTNDVELGEVADKIKRVKQLAKIVKDKKEKFTEPAKAIITEARETYDPMIKECQNAEEVLKGRAKKYMVEQDRKRMEQEAKIAARVEKGTMKTETAMRKIEAMPEVQKTIRTDTGSALRMTKRRVAKIVNPEMIPDEYWVIDEVRVRREALARDKSNLPQITGVEIVEEADMSSL